MKTLQSDPCRIMDRGCSPVCVRAVLGDDHLQLAQPTYGCSVSAGGELQEESLLLLTERVQRLPELPVTMQTDTEVRLCAVLEYLSEIHYTLIIDAS